MQRYRLSDEDVRAVLSLLWTQGEVASDPKNVAEITGDPADNVVLAVCHEAGAELLVTGDRELLALESHHSVRIVPPREFLTILSDTRS